MNSAPSLGQRILRRKPLEDFACPARGDGAPRLQRSLSLFQLTMFGVGATIGTGIFFVLAEQVPVAGPAVLVSFLIAGVAAGLTALCYAEMSSMIPVSGSSYSYAYATLGEGVAFLVAACLIMEYGVSAGAVAVGWSEYLHNLLLTTTGLELPRALLVAPLVAEGYSLHPGGEGLINLPAAVLVFLCCILLLRGPRESARANGIIVVLKLAVLAIFVALALTAFDSGNFAPFSPNGLAGISAAAGSIFFTFIGLDTVSTAAEEIEDPRRNLPRAIILALLIVLGFYVLVAVAALGAQSQGMFEGQEAGLAVILHNVTGSHLPSVILSAGAVISVFSVTLVVLYGQTRVLFAMARDGMLPGIFCRVNPRSMTPTANTLIVSCAVAAIAAFMPSDVLWDLTSMGTLVAFSVVSAGVIILRYRQPEAPRGFRVPLFPLLPVLSILACLYLISSLSLIVFKLAGIWAFLAAVMYLSYSARNSALERGRAGA
ncbi:amino acid permease [Paracoccus sp. (in: a-proteobacteria)]|uniref:amino acid permease n=1 Tax=Paracoccus sp. TaxID=267 RepID=UPI00321F726A